MKDQQNYSFLNWPKAGLWKEYKIDWFELYLKRKKEEKYCFFIMQYGKLVQVIFNVDLSVFEDTVDGSCVWDS